MCVSKNEFIYEGDADGEEMLQAHSEKSQINFNVIKIDFSDHTESLDLKFIPIFLAWVRLDFSSLKLILLELV
jgi:hypothetical protein